MGFSRKYVAPALMASTARGNAALPADDQHFGPWLQGLEAAHQVRAVDIGEDQVHQRRVGLPTQEQRLGLGATCRDTHVVPGAGHRQRQPLRHVGLVVDDEHAPHPFAAHIQITTAGSRGHSMVEVSQSSLDCSTTGRPESIHKSRCVGSVTSSVAVAQRHRFRRSTARPGRALPGRRYNAAHVRRSQALPRHQLAAVTDRSSGVGRHRENGVRTLRRRQRLPDARRLAVRRLRLQDRLLRLVRPDSHGTPPHPD